MAPDPALDELERLERLWLLPVDATPLQRALAYRPHCGPAWVHRNKVIARLCREAGMRPPWSANLAREKWPASWSDLVPWHESGGATSPQ